MKSKEILKGRGAQYNPSNPFFDRAYVEEYNEGIDEFEEEAVGQTRYILQEVKSAVNKVTSPDVGMEYSVNPYQGCEHGCIYCYARPTHEYWGYSAGLDFERVIIAKSNVVSLVEKYINRKKYEPGTIVLSGNTDCYQPLERKLRLTRGLLELFNRRNQPSGIITKNYTIVRDLDILAEMAEKKIISVAVSVTSLDKTLYQKLEPRTAPPLKRLKTIEALSKIGVPVTVMNAPIIPGLNDHEIPNVLKAASEAGAQSAGYTMVRLNGSLQGLFDDWLKTSYPDKYQKVIQKIKECHDGKLNDSRYGVRMRGTGKIAEMVHELFRVAKSKHFQPREKSGLRKDLFIRKEDLTDQLKLF